MKLKLNILLLALLVSLGVQAQHTVGLSGGMGAGMARFYPARETKMLIGGTNFGLSWRYYSLPRFVGAVGVDLEVLKRGFSYGYTYTSSFDENGAELREYSYYNRSLNTVMLPIVWQPHVYFAKNHVRLYLEAAFTLQYNFGGKYDYDDQTAAGKYNWRTERDVRWGYGLAGGGGFALLFGRYEIGVRARYYYGYSDLMRNMNKYYDNTGDGPENPFTRTPLKSPIDNMNISITLAYRFNKDGFDEWFYKPKKRDKRNREFNFQKSENSD